MSAVLGTFTLDGLRLLLRIQRQALTEAISFADRSESQATQAEAAAVKARQHATAMAEHVVVMRGNITEIERLIAGFPIEAAPRP